MLKNKGINTLISELYFNSKVITDINQNEILDSTKRHHIFINNTVTTSFIFLVDFVFIIIQNQFIPKFMGDFTRSRLQKQVIHYQDL